MVLTSEEQARISDAIQQAEAKTSGEIVCVLARSASNYGSEGLVIALAMALAVPLPLILLTNLSVQLIYLAQLLVFSGVALVLALAKVRMALIPRSIKRARAHRAAMEQFFTRGMTRTKEGTGVLIFVSLAERYARIVADDGIAAKVEQKQWQNAVNGLVARMRADEPAEGFIEAIASCGAILAAHFPPGDENPDELPDKIYIV